MAIPDYQTLMLPVLSIAKDSAEHRIRDVIDQLGTKYGVTDEERLKLIPSGRQPMFDNRVHWAKAYLIQAKLLEATQRGRFRITNRGKETLATSPARIDNNYLQRFPEFVKFRRRTPDVDQIPIAADVEVTASAATPDELLRSTIKQIEETLKKEMLDRVIASSAAFFEHLIVDLLLSMNYGFSREDAGQVVGKSGDGGIDGVIYQDQLGLDRVYIQAKKYAPDNAVSEPEIRAFTGSLGANKADRGIFVTTSYFTQPALNFADRHPFRIVLIDGEKLSELMLKHDVGARKVETLHLKKLDEDFFLDA